MEAKKIALIAKKIEISHAIWHDDDKILQISQAQAKAKAESNKEKII